MAETDKAKSKPTRLDSKQLEFLIESLTIVLTAQSVMEEVYGHHADDVRSEAKASLEQWLREKNKQLRFA